MMFWRLGVAASLALLVLGIAATASSQPLAAVAADDPDDGVWLQRRDAARADAAVGEVVPLRRENELLKQEIVIRDRIEGKQEKLIQLECRGKILALQEAAYWQRRFHQTQVDAHRQHEKDRTETGVALGASVGSVIAPGLGTLIGAAAGAGAGWLSAGRAPKPPEPVASTVELDPERACRPPDAAEKRPTPQVVTTPTAPTPQQGQ